MKKLFTFLALMACFMSANAKVVEDVVVDFSTMADGATIKFYGWGASASAKERLSIKGGCLHFESTEATEPSWDCQFHPIGGVSAEEGVTYTLHFKVKGDHAENISALGFGLTPYGQFPITTEWVEGTFDYVAANSSGDILFQCGGYIGTWDIAYLKITHEEAESAPVQWKNIIENGDASTAWANPDMTPKTDGEPTPGWNAVCAWGKEWGYMMNDTEKTAQGTPAIPVAHPALIEKDGDNDVFVCHAKAVEPPLLEGSDGERWGSQYHAGDLMPNNTWQNQFWIAFPRPLHEGEDVKISFRYKASKAIEVSTQDHTVPGDYLGNGKLGSINFTTEWQTYEKQFTAAEGVQSIAFNVTGKEEGDYHAWQEDIDFYFDDIMLSEMDLEKGWFVASSNADTGIEYNYGEAIQFVDGTVKYEGDDVACLVATVGTAGNQESWVNKVKISTRRGNDKGFQANTITFAKDVTFAQENWLNYISKGKQEITLPTAGVWTIGIYEEDGLIFFHKVEGEAEKEPTDIVINTSELVINAVEREYTEAEAKDLGIEKPENPGNPWDNQFFIVPNRALKKGEVTVVEFDYSASADAKTTTQCQTTPGAYVAGAALGQVDFTTEELHFKGDVTIEPESLGAIAFNMAEIKAANVYNIKNVKWYLKNAELNEEGKTLENLINADGTENFQVKIGAGNPIVAYGTDGIQVVSSQAKIGTAVLYNLAGQRVAKDYNGIVVKEGKKIVNK